jgi:hypothetical protein
MTRLIKWSVNCFCIGCFFQLRRTGCHHQRREVLRCGNSDSHQCGGCRSAVLIPACPWGVSWTTKITVTKGITIQGAGIDVTVLLDGVFKGNASCGGTAPMLQFSAASPKKCRLTALTIRGSATDSFGCLPGHVAIDGTSKAWRVDDVRIENQQTVGIRVDGDTWGVVDHNQFQGVYKNGMIVSHSQWGGPSLGDGSWADLTAASHWPDRTIRRVVQYWSVRGRF